MNMQSTLLKVPLLDLEQNELKNCPCQTRLVTKKISHTLLCSLVLIGTTVMVASHGDIPTLTHTQKNSQQQQQQLEKVNRVSTLSISVKIQNYQKMPRCWCYWVEMSKKKIFNDQPK